MTDPFTAAIAANQALNAEWSRANRVVRPFASGVNRGLLTHRPAGYTAVATGNFNAAALTSTRDGLTLVSGSLSLGLNSLEDVAHLLEAMRSAARQAMTTRDKKARTALERQFNAMLRQTDLRLANARINGVPVDTAPVIRPANWPSAVAIEANIGAIDMALNSIRATTARYTAPPPMLEPYQVNGAAAILAEPPGKLPPIQKALAQTVVDLARLRNGVAAPLVQIEDSVKPQPTSL